MPSGGCQVPSGDVVGEVVGTFVIEGTAYVLDAGGTGQAMMLSGPESGMLQADPTPTPRALLPLQLINLPTCGVTITANPDRIVYAYDTSMEALIGDGSITILNGATVTVDLRSMVNRDVVRGWLTTDTQIPPETFWFYSGGGSVVESDGNCNDLLAETLNPDEATTTLEDDYGVLLRSEAGYEWTESEIGEIYSGVIMTAASFARLSNLELNPPDLFRFIMTDEDVLPYIVLYKGVGVPNTAQLSVSIEVPDPSGNVGTEMLTITYEAEIADGGCLTSNGTGTTQQLPNARPRIIACNSLPVVSGAELVLAGASGQTNLSFTQYLLVHELGHIFDNRTSSTNCGPTSLQPSCRLLNLAFQGVASGNCPTFLRDALRANANSPVPPGTNPLQFDTTCVYAVNSRLFTIMGNTSTGQYMRRDRGWGTGPHNIFTDFQQHPAGVFASDSPELILEEEAADMFLNWVYRTLSDRSSDVKFTYLVAVPGEWNGFRNQSWGTYGPYTVNGDDDSYPGDARLEWMHIVMQNIFDEKGW